jgi:hypothetical protein
LHDLDHSQQGEEDVEIEGEGDELNEDSNNLQEQLLSATDDSLQTAGSDLNDENSTSTIDIVK